MYIRAMALCLTRIVATFVECYKGGASITGVDKYIALTLR